MEDLVRMYEDTIRVLGDRIKKLKNGDPEVVGEGQFNTVHTRISVLEEERMQLIDVCAELRNHNSITK